MNLAQNTMAVFAAAALAGVCSAAADTLPEKVTTTKTTTTTTVITETVTQEKAEWSPFTVCVLDFTTADTIGQKRFLDTRNTPIAIPPQCTLNKADRTSVNAVMQGYVRMIDALDASQTNDANRAAQKSDNAFTRAKALELYNATVKGEQRPVVIGAEYLTAYLGKHNDVFSCVDSAVVADTMAILQKDANFPQDFMLCLSRSTGATHLITATVSDVSSSVKSFKGYGIETQSTLYKLDLIVKMTDLRAQKTVYSNVFTGTAKTDVRPAVQNIDNNLYQTLLTSAIQQAAEELYDVCKPGRKNKITVTPLPEAK